MGSPILMGLPKLQYSCSKTSAILSHRAREGLLEVREKIVYSLTTVVLKLVDPV